MNNKFIEMKSSREKFKCRRLVGDFVYFAWVYKRLES